MHNEMPDDHKVVVTLSRVSNKPWGVQLAANMELLGCVDGSVAAHNELARSCVGAMLATVDDILVDTPTAARATMLCSDVIVLCFHHAINTNSIPKLRHESFRRTSTLPDVPDTQQ